MFDSLKSGAMTFLAGLVVVLAVLLFSSWGRVELAQSRQATAEADLKAEKEAQARTRDAVAAQKREAANELRSANASVLATQNLLDATRAAQAKSDAANLGLVGDLRRSLLALRDARRLQLAAEAGRRGDGGSAEQGGGGPAAPGGGRDEAAARRILPVPTAGPGDEEDDDAFDADRINAAYVSCRADAVNIRAALAP